jgi:hypothetical protein
MEMAMWLDYKPTRYEGKGFLRNLNTRLHRDITGEMWFVGGVRSEEETSRIIPRSELDGHI